VKFKQLKQEGNYQNNLGSNIVH